MKEIGSVFGIYNFFSGLGTIAGNIGGLVVVEGFPNKNDISPDFLVGSVAVSVFGTDNKLPNNGTGGTRGIYFYSLVVDFGLSPSFDTGGPNSGVLNNEEAELPGAVVSLKGVDVLPGKNGVEELIGAV